MALSPYTKAPGKITVSTRSWFSPNMSFGDLGLCGDRLIRRTVVPQFRRRFITIESQTFFRMKDAADLSKEMLRPTMSILDLYDLEMTALRQRELVDRNLTRVAPWTGLTRREILGHAVVGDRERYRAAYDRCSKVAKDPAWRPTVEQLLLVNTLVGGPGSFRKRGVRVGRYVNFPSPKRLVALIGSFMNQHPAKPEHAICESLRLHLNIVTAHPFSDANGRSARLIASMCLMNQGFCSTLVTALEEIFGLSAHAYIDTLNRYWAGRASETETLARLVLLYLRRSLGLAAIRARHDHLLELCDRIKIKRRLRDETVQAVELGLSSSAQHRLLQNAMLLTGMTPWSKIVLSVPSSAQVELKEQLLRLRYEEITE